MVFALGTLALANAGLIPQGYAVSSLLPAPLLHVPYTAIVPVSNGLEGQYVPDNTEKLYDDGSYKPELKAIPLSPTPYGLAPTGSGLEGQYFPDNTEKLYDDGSYKPELSPIPLSVSPYGLVPSGTGIEGAYVHDLSETLYDDGSYKPGLYQ